MLNIHHEEQLVFCYFLITVADMKIDYYVVLLKSSCTVNSLVCMREISNGSRLLILENVK